MLVLAEVGWGCEVTTGAAGNVGVAMGVGVVGVAALPAVVSAMTSAIDQVPMYIVFFYFTSQVCFHLTRMNHWLLIQGVPWSLAEQD